MAVAEARAERRLARLCRLAILDAAINAPPQPSFQLTEAICSAVCRSGTLQQRIRRNRLSPSRVTGAQPWRRTDMDFGKGALLWLLGVPLPVILLIALFWHH